MYQICLRNWAINFATLQVFKAPKNLTSVYSVIEIYIIILKLSTFYVMNTTEKQSLVQRRHCILLVLFSVSFDSYTNKKYTSTDRFGITYPLSTIR